MQRTKRTNFVRFSCPQLTQSGHPRDVIRHMLADPTRTENRPRVSAGKRSLQVETLALGAGTAPEKAPGNDPAGRLVRRLRKAGISEFHPDPLAAPKLARTVMADPAGNPGSYAALLWSLLSSNKTCRRPDASTKVTVILPA